MPLQIKYRCGEEGLVAVPKRLSPLGPEEYQTVEEDATEVLFLETPTGPGWNIEYGLEVDPASIADNVGLDEDDVRNPTFIADNGYDAGVFERYVRPNTHKT